MKIFDNTKLDEFIVCANCDHIQELHKWCDYDGWRCIHSCDCEKFVVKVDAENKVIYEVKE